MFGQTRTSCLCDRAYVHCRKPFPSSLASIEPQLFKVFGVGFTDSVAASRFATVRRGERSAASSKRLGYHQITILRTMINS
jgi:hypothetical protein